MQEVLTIVESLCGATGDLLRPMVIRESDVDELCRSAVFLYLYIYITNWYDNICLVNVKESCRLSLKISDLKFWPCLFLNRS